MSLTAIQVRELRGAPRFDLRLPFACKWRHDRKLLATTTTNISTKGQFVISELPPPIGSVGDFEVDLAWDTKEHPNLIIRGACRIVRLDTPLNGPAGFAAVNLWFEIVEPQNATLVTKALERLIARPGLKTA